MFHHSSRNPRPRFASALLLAVLCIGLFASMASACPNCKAALPNGSAKDGAPAEPQTAQGYAWSIYLFLAVPFLMVATMGTTAFVLVRKASARQRMARGV